MRDKLGRTVRGFNVKLACLKIARRGVEPGSGTGNLEVELLHNGQPMLWHEYPCGTLISLRNNNILLRNDTKQRLGGKPAMTPTYTKIRFDIHALESAIGSCTARGTGEILGLSTKAIHNRRLRGLTWADADDLSIRCGYMPWEIWPEWADVDPSLWIEPACPTCDMFDAPNGTAKACAACSKPTLAAA